MIQLLIFKFFIYTSQISVSHSIPVLLLSNWDRYCLWRQFSDTTRKMTCSFVLPSAFNLHHTHVLPFVLNVVFCSQFYIVFLGVAYIQQPLKVIFRICYIYNIYRIYKCGIYTRSSNQYHWNCLKLFVILFIIKLKTNRLDLPYLILPVFLSTWSNKFHLRLLTSFWYLSQNYGSDVVIHLLLIP